MNSREKGIFTLSMSFLLASLVAIASCAGLFWPSTYARETLLWAAEGMGGDVINLFLVVPVLVVSGIFAFRGSVPARLVWMGSLLYLIYNFIIYTLAVHFNGLFLVYCAALGLSFYAFVGSLPSLSPERIAESSRPRAPVRAAALAFFLLAFFAAAGWLREIIPALLSGRAPASAVDVRLPTNPVHVLDLSLLLPGLVITAIMLLRRKAMAFVLAPMLLTFLMLMSAQLAAIIVATAWKRLATDYYTAGFFIALAAGFGFLLARFHAGKSPSLQSGVRQKAA